MNGVRGRERAVQKDEMFFFHTQFYLTLWDLFGFIA